MKYCVFPAVVASLLCAAAAATISSRGNATHLNADPIRKSAADNELFNMTARQEIFIVTIDSMPAASTEASPSCVTCTRSERMLSQPPPSRRNHRGHLAQPHLELKNAPIFSSIRQQISGVIIGKHSNNSDKSGAPWFLDGPAFDSSHAGAEGKSSGKVRGGINPYVPQQNPAQHVNHDAFLRFISEDSTAKLRFTGLTNSKFRL